MYPRDLADALAAAYPHRQAFSHMLFFEVRIRLDELVGDVGMREVIYTVLLQLEAEGRLHELIDAVLRDRPGNPGLRAWAAACGWHRPSADMQLPPNIQALDTAYFDLAPLKEAIEDHVLYRPPGLLAVSLPVSEPTLVKRLCAWMPHCLGNVEPEDPINLNPLIDQWDVAVKHALDYLPKLETGNVLCPIQTEKASLDGVGRFWDGVRSGCGAPQFWFVLLFVGLPGGMIRGIKDLPPPAFRDTDVARWARNVLAHLDWPRELALPWSRHIVRQATLDDTLDLRLTYLNIERTIDRLHEDRPAFRRWLEHEYQAMAPGETI